MTKAAILAEIVTEWAKLNAAEMASVLGQFRRCPSIAGRAHVSKLGKVKPGTHMVGRPDAAKLLGISLTTLDAWDRRGWIIGKIKASNTIWYPKVEVTKARRRAKKRRGE
ncbi:MAG: hypothetical protein AAF333_16435 [Planctomycetota bacterium]